MSQLTRNRTIFAQLGQTMKPSLLQIVSLFLSLQPSNSWISTSRTQRQPTQLFGKGFADKKGPAVRKKASAKSIYSMPALYDLAFGYRDYQEAVDFLLDVHDEHAGYPACDVLELAAGPGRHALQALLQMEERGVWSSHCVDLSPDMKAYAENLAEELLSSSQKAGFNYVLEDMRSFSVNKTFDTSWILLGSLQHMVTNEDVIRCFKAVHAHLKTSGTLIVELPHPRETFSMVECTKNGWKVPLEDEAGTDSGQLEIVWGDTDDDFDPITQVRNFTVSMELQNTGQTEDMHNVRQIVSLSHLLRSMLYQC